MAIVAGKAGSFKVGAVVVANIKSFKLDIQLDLKESTNFGSAGWKEQKDTIKSFSGSCDGQWNVATDTTGQKALQDALLGGTVVSGVFNINGTNNYTGNVYVKKISIGQPVDDIVSFSCDLEGTSALTYA